MSAPSPVPEGLMVPQAEALIAATGADFPIGGDRAFYSPNYDFIQVPRPEAYFEPINWLSLPKTRSACIDGVALQGSGARQCFHIARSGACRARPSPAKHEFAPHYNSGRISKEFAEGALR